ncbi:MAG: flagellar M-ring protein FliF [Fimbriimonadaceae bacterium]|nr:flagellar M-ring protein FliF [Fimbriimonadaceae bacterium]
MSAIFLKLRTWWETADRTQRVVSVFGGAFLVVLLGLTFFFASRPKMDLLYGGLSSKDVGTVADELQKAGIPYEFDLQGNVKVPSGQIPTAKASLAKSGWAPTGAHSGYADFDKLGMMTTPTVERERIKVAIEGELAKSVEQIDGVSSARVHLTLGNDSPFVREEKAPTASVFVTQAGDSGVGPEQARAIARLVANSVPKLDVKNIAVISSEGRTLWDGQSETGAEGRASIKVQAEIAESKRREAEIQSKLDAVLGRGNAVASVDVTMDFDQTSQNETLVTPSEQPISREKLTETMKDGSKAASGGDPFAAGTNTPSSGGASESAGGYTNKQESEEYERNVTRRNTEKAVGTLKSMSINVLVNKAKVTDIAPVQEFLDGYLGTRTDDPNFTSSVTSLDFDTSAQRESVAAAGSAASAARMQQLISLLPIAALLLVGFMVIKSLGKAVKPNVMVAAMPDGSTMPVSIGSANPGHAALPAAGTMTTVTTPSGTQVQVPQVVAPDGSLVPAYTIDLVTGEPIVGIAERVDVPLEQIKKMSRERPDVVAMLLKSWILEERR